MNDTSLHWWKSGSESDVAKGMRIRFWNGKPYPRERAVVKYGRAAFCYEHEARVNQKKHKATQPLYRFGKPFPQLSQEQKELLRIEFPSRRWQLLPEERSLRTAPKYELADEPPRGWIDIHFWANPSTMSRHLVLKEIRRYFDEQKKLLGTIRKPNSKIRTRPYSWKSLEFVDNFLKGKGNEWENSYARLVLKRTY